MQGIENATEVVELGGTMVSALREIKADHKVNLKDIGPLLRVVKLLRPALAGMDAAWDELRELDPAEAGGLADLFLLRAGLPMTEAMRRAAISTLLALGELMSALKTDGGLATPNPAGDDLEA